MRRRDVITLLGGAATWPFAARAQNSDRPHVGFLSGRSAPESAHLVDAFRGGLAEHGFVEGKNIVVEYRWADAQYERLPGQATELVDRHIAVLVSVGGDMTVKAAASVTSTTPIVAIFIGDPVAGGYVESLNKPGGHITGVNNLNAVIEAKRLGLLREVKPDAATIGALLNPDSPTAASQRKDIEQAAESIGLKVKFLEARNDSGLETAFGIIAQNRIPGLLVPADAFFAASRAKIAELAARNAVPTISSLREAALAGGLMSYGNNLPETYRLVGSYVSRILKGEKAADLPVLQPTKFQFVLNLKTAKALGLTIPPGVLAIADEVIE